MFDFFAPQTLVILAVAIAIAGGAYTASRQPGGILGAVARGAKGTVVRGVFGLVLFGAIYAFATSDFGGRQLGTKDPLDGAKVGDCVAGSTQQTTRVVPCDDAFAKTKIVRIFEDATPGASLTAAACGGVDAADSAFEVTDLSGRADHATAYCTKTL